LSFNLKLLNLFFGMCSGTQGLPPGLHALGYIPEAVETTFTNSEDRNVAPDLIIASAQVHHTVCFEWKSGANTEADQLQRYSGVEPNDLVAKAFVHVNKCATHDIAIIGKDEHRATIPIGVQNGGYTFPVLVTTAAGMEIILNAFSHAPTDGVFRPLNVNWDTLPTSFFPLDGDSELWEFAEHAIPYVLEQMVKGAPRIRMDDLAKAMIPHYDRMRPDYKGQLKQKIQQVMDHASRAQFSTYLQRAPRAAAGVMQTPTWDVINNPLVGTVDKRQKAWKALQKKHQSLIDHFKNPQRQEVLEMDEGEAVGN
jgi:hypothetical protein